MKQRRYTHRVCLYHKIINHKTPLYLYNKVNHLSDIHSVNTRGKYKLQIPNHKFSFYKKSFSYNIANCVNSLNLEITKLSFYKFK